MGDTVSVVSHPSGPKIQTGVLRSGGVRCGRQTGRKTRRGGGEWGAEVETQNDAVAATRLFGRKIEMRIPTRVAFVLLCITRWWTGGGQGFHSPAIQWWLIVIDLISLVHYRHLPLQLSG